VARRTKIVATLGPASTDPEVLDALVAAGVDVVRLNLSHGVVDEHLQRMADVRAAAARAGRPVGILADLPGPKIRCGGFGDRGVHLAESLVELLPGNERSTARAHRGRLPGPARRPPRGRHGGGGRRRHQHRGGARERRSGAGPGAHGRAGHGAPRVPHPLERLRLTTPTTEDLELACSVRPGPDLDFLAVSFVRTADDLERVREVVGGTALTWWPRSRPSPR
jgi:pyruvate kinase